MTLKQRNDLECIKWFIPRFTMTITPEDEHAFLLFSEKGIKPKLTPGITALFQGKKWRNVNLKMWKEDIEEGILSQEELFREMPKVVQDWFLLSTRKS